jgi:hypothetical protein
MSTINTLAFRNNGPGIMVDTTTNQLRLLSMKESERARGYVKSCMHAPCISWRARHKITGGCMDRFAMMHLFAVAHAVRIAHQGQSYEGTHPIPSTPVASAAQMFSDKYTAAMAADIQDASLATPEIADIWDDSACIKFLQQGEFNTQQKRRS